MRRDKGSGTHSPDIRRALTIPLETATRSAETRLVIPIRPVSSTPLPEAMQDCLIPQALTIPLAAIKLAFPTLREIRTPSVASLPATPITAGVAIPLVELVQGTITQQASIILLLEPWLAFRTRLEITTHLPATRLVCATRLATRTSTMD